MQYISSFDKMLWFAAISLDAGQSCTVNVDVSSLPFCTLAHGGDLVWYLSPDKVPVATAIRTVVASGDPCGTRILSLERPSLAHASYHGRPEWRLPLPSLEE